AADWASGSPASSSWSVKAHRRTPRAWARWAKAVGLKVPSEKVEWQCRSTLRLLGSVVVAVDGMQSPIKVADARAGGCHGDICAFAAMSAKARCAAQSGEKSK